ncbi:DUF6339 family protein [Mycolicibacterium sp. XJ2546]
MKTLRSLDHTATQIVSGPGFRLGTESPSLKDFESETSLSHPVDLDAVRVFIDEVEQRFGDNGTEADVWLAPRLHYSLRLTRREAADRGLWRWLACCFAPEYVRWRWGPPGGSIDPDKAAKTERFVGPDYKHALARLWWMAELFRDGPDYTPVMTALKNQDIPNNLFRMDIAHHRPTVLAATRVLESRSGREANALAKAVNAAAGTLVIDLLAPDEPLDPDTLRSWLNDSIDPNLYLDELPPGPADPVAPPHAIAHMEQLLTELLAEAPVRGRRKDENTN